jgi:hypothetical protein
MFISGSAGATDYTSPAGLIKDLVGADSGTGTLGWVSVTGFPSANNCTTTNDPLVLIRVRADAQGNQMWALLLAARTAGRTVKVRVNDANKVGTTNDCYLRIVWLLD